VAPSSRPKCCGRSHRSNRPWTDPGNEEDERHGWRLSQHQPRPASETQPGPDRRDFEVSGVGGRGDPSPRLPARTGQSSSLSPAVTNPGCERTAGKIPGSGELVNRTLEILGGIPIFLSIDLKPARSKRGDRVDIDGNFDMRRRWMPDRHRRRQSLERLRLWAPKLKVEPVEVPDLDDGRRCRAQDAH
jgi:hypothetical protein